MPAFDGCVYVCMCSMAFVCVYEEAGEDCCPSAILIGKEHLNFMKKTQQNISVICLRTWFSVNDNLKLPKDSF